MQYDEETSDGDEGGYTCESPVTDFVIVNDQMESLVDLS